eukprot:2873371-Rhodomonas_salina.1
MIRQDNTLATQRGQRGCTPVRARAWDRGGQSRGLGADLEENNLKVRDSFEESEQAQPLSSEQLGPEMRGSKPLSLSHADGLPLFVSKLG